MPSKPVDKRIKQVHDILSDHSLTTPNLLMCDKSREIKEWIEEKSEMEFEDLVHFPGGFQWILRQVFEYHLEAKDVGTADYVYTVLNRLKKLRHLNV